MKLKTLIIGLFMLMTGCQAALAQTTPIIPNYRADFPYHHPLDSLLFNFTGKPDGYSSLYTGWYLNTRFLRMSDSTIYVPFGYFHSHIGTPDGIISGLKVSVSSPNVTIAHGSWSINNQTYTMASDTAIAFDPQDATKSRYDVLYADTLNTIGLVSGTLSATPTEPDIPDNTLEVGIIFITPTSVSTALVISGVVKLTGNQNPKGIKNWQSLAKFSNNIQFVKNLPADTVGGNHFTLNSSGQGRLDTATYAKQFGLYNLSAASKHYADSLYTRSVNLFDSQTVSGNKKFKGDVTLNNTYLFLDSADNTFVRYNDSISGYGPIGHIISLGAGSGGGVGFSITNFSTNPFALFTYNGSSLQNSLLISDTFEPYNQIDGNAAFQIQSTTKGLIFPNMTYAQRSAISPSAYNGSRALTVFQTDAGDKGSGLYLLGNSNVWDRIATLSDIPGGGGGGTVVNSFNSRTGAISPALEDYTGYYIPHFASLTALEAYSGSATTVNVDTTGRGGTFILLAGSPTLDYGVNFPSAISGHYWHRQVDPGAYYKLEWWGLVGDGTTDNQPAIQRAVNYLSGLGGGTLSLFTKGVYDCKETITWANYVNLYGPGDLSSGFNYTNDDVVLLDDSTASPNPLISFAGLKQIYFANMVLSGYQGNNYTNPVANGIGCNSSTQSITLQNCKIHNFNYGFFGNSASTIRLLVCSMRANYVNVYDIGDSYIGGVGSYYGDGLIGNIYINSGQTRIEDIHCEFAQGSGATSAFGIKFGSNSNRCIVEGITTDRNAGNDIWIAGTSTNQPYQMQIVGNMFKRAGWGTDLNESTSVSVLATYTNSLTIIGNHFYAAAYGAGNFEGVYSPTQAINATNCNNLVIQSNNTFPVKNKVAVSANDGNYQWLPTGLGDNSYYLLRGTIGTTDYNPEIGQPDQMDYLSHYLTLGTLGSLTTGQYAWGDPASLGYSTLIVRLFWDVSPTTLAANTLFAEYNQKPVTLDNTSSNIRTDRWLSQAPYQTINSGSQGNFTLNTQSLTLVQQTGTYSIIFNAREVSSNARIYGVLPITIINNASTYPSVTLGTPETLGGSGITLATSGSTGFVVDSVRTDGIGSILKVYVTNHDSHNASLEVDLQNSAGAGLADKIPASVMPAFTGDVTTTAGNVATTVGKIGGKAVSLAGAFTLSGAYGFTGTLTGTTSVTFPTSGTLSTLSGSETLANKTLTTPKLTGYTVATLPSGTVGMIAYVTDALTPVALSTVVGGGSSVVPVFYNGSNWIVQ